MNRIITYVPLSCIRKSFYFLLGLRFGKNVTIDIGQYFLMPYKLRLGDNVHINQGCVIDSREKISIGNNVCIGHKNTLITGSHDINDPSFPYKGGEIIIEDYVFLGANVTILQNVKISKGAVICAGAVVTKDVPENAIMAGIPAKQIGVRNGEYKYIVKPKRYFF